MELTPEQVKQLQLAFKYPRGRYGVERASQLSGVPVRTIHDWARAEVYVPDFNLIRPKLWSYRDLVFLRLFAWLRTKRMDRPDVAHRVRLLKRMIEADEESLSYVRSDGRILLQGGNLTDDLTGQQAFALVASHLDVFDLTAPVDASEFGRATRLWGPNLVKPSLRTSMSPWIMAGEPCINETRIPTIGIFSLHHQRGLTSSAIAEIYEVDSDEVSDALQLEDRLHHLLAAA